MSHHLPLSAVSRRIQPTARAAGMRNTNVIMSVSGPRDIGDWRITLCGSALTGTLHHRRFEIEMDLVAACGDPVDTELPYGREGEALRLETLAALAADDIDTAANLLESLAAGVFEELSLRARAAATLGLPADGANLGVVSHVHLDRWTMDQMRERHGVDPGELIEDAIDELARVPSDDEARRLTYSGVQFQPSGRLRWVAGVPVPMVTVPLQLHGGRAKFDGATLTVADALPETALAACIGRPLGSIVRTATVLDDRIVLDAWSEGPSSGFSLESDPVAP